MIALVHGRYISRAGGNHPADRPGFRLGPGSTASVH